MSYRAGAVVLDPNAPLFSLGTDGGAGALIGLAAGDALGDEKGRYSAITQVATVLAYHLIERDGIDGPALAADLLLLDGAEDGLAVYRRPSSELLAWLARAHSGRLVASPEPSSEPAARIGPVGVWFRADAEGLVEATVGAVTLTHNDPATVAAAVAAAAAVAGSSFGQSGTDLVLGAAEAVEAAVAAFVEAGLDDSAPPAFAGRLRRLAPAAVDASLDDFDGASGPLAPAVVGIVIGASRARTGPELVTVAERSGGRAAAIVAGAIAGARMGLVRWPWPVANDMWFAEIGRRLVDHVREVRDLPVPYAVEHHLDVSIGVTPEL